MRQTLTDHFWGLNKNMNCEFPLKWRPGVKEIHTYSDLTDQIVPENLHEVSNRHLPAQNL